MPSPEENVLRHDPLGTYDKAQAHEYYMRTRVLKGRKAAVVKVPVGRSRSGATSTSVKSKPRQQKVVIIRKTAAERTKEKKALKAHVAALQKRLAALKKILAELVKQAKARSGVKTEPKPGSPEAVAAAKTTSEKKTAAAKSSKTYYEKNKEKILAKAKAEAEANSPTDLEAKIKEVTDKIAEMRAELKSKLKP